MPGFVCNDGKPPKRWLRNRCRSLLALLFGFTTRKLEISNLGRNRRTKPSYETPKKHYQRQPGRGLFAGIKSPHDEKLGENSPMEPNIQDFVREEKKRLTCRKQRRVLIFCNSIQTNFKTIALEKRIRTEKAEAVAFCVPLFFRLIQVHE